MEGGDYDEVKEIPSSFLRQAKAPIDYLRINSKNEVHCIHIYLLIHEYAYVHVYVWAYSKNKISHKYYIYNYQVINEYTIW